MSGVDAGTKVVQRFEVFTGGGQRRAWSADAKAAIVAESFAGLESVCALARRHGLSQSQLFTWRRQVRQDAEITAKAGSSRSTAVLTEPLFVPAVIQPIELLPVAGKAGPAARPRHRRTAKSAAPAVELEIGGVSVKIAKGTDAGTITAVIEALKIKP